MNNIHLDCFEINPYQLSKMTTSLNRERNCEPLLLSFSAVFIDFGRLFPRLKRGIIPYPETFEHPCPSLCPSSNPVIFFLEGRGEWRGPHNVQNMSAPWSYSVTYSRSPIVPYSTHSHNSLWFGLFAVVGVFNTIICL